MMRQSTGSLPEVEQNHLLKGEEIQGRTLTARLPMKHEMAGHAAAAAEV
jgi:hypothetical protein